MNKLASLLILIALVVVGVGFYRGWFVLSSERDVGTNKVDIQLTVDPDQVKRDAQQASPAN